MKATKFSVVQAVKRIILGLLVTKIIIIILIFRISSSENKIVDHLLKETCAIRLVQVTYETNHIFILHDSTMLKALIFFMYFIVI